MMFKKLISCGLITALITMINHNLLAYNSAFESAKSAVSNSQVFDGQLNSYKATLPQPQPSTHQPTTNNPQEEPSFTQKLVQDIKDNKTTYATVLGAAGFLGFLLGGPVGMLVGIGAMFAFAVTQRADYIDSFVKPKK